MKSLMLRLYLVVALVGMTLGGAANSAFAQDERGGAGERLERLEKRINELAERQDQLMRRLGAQIESQRPMAWQGGENIRQPMHPRSAPATGPHNPPGAKVAKGAQDILGLLFLIGILCNILLAIWIFTDIRKRGEGSGIFVAMALVAGIPAAIIYALVRLGDKKA